MKRRILALRAPLTDAEGKNARGCPILLGRWKDSLSW